MAGALTCSPFPDAVLVRALDRSREASDVQAQSDLLDAVSVTLGCLGDDLFADDGVVEEQIQLTATIVLRLAGDVISDDSARPKEGLNRGPPNASDGAFWA